MVEDDLRITNEIWRKWDEQKITPPMTWQQLWDKVREYIKAGKDPYDILRGPAPSKEWMEKKGFVEDYGKTIQQEITAAIAEEKEAIDDYADLENKLRKAGLNSQADIVNEIRNDEIDHKKKFEALTIHHSNPDKLKDLFAGRTLEGYVEAARVRTLETFKGATFYFETKEERERARELLARHKFYFPYGPDFSLTAIDNPDYMLEILASEGFDTSKIMVER
jgi:hypothetical protein